MSHSETTAPTTPLTGFHNEARDRVFDARQSRASLPSAVALESLILGAQLRGWLTDREKSLLDSLAFDGGLTFMLSGRRYIHPEEVALIPVDELIADPGYGKSGMVTRQVQTGDAGGSRRYSTVHTAAINPGESTPLTLGMFGSHDPRSRRHRSDRFASAATAMRDAWSAIRSELGKMTRRMQSPVPMMLVGRTSGRIIAANQPALEMVAVDARELIGQEFTNAIRELRPVPLLHMEHMMAGELALTCVHLGNANCSPADPASIPTHHIVHQLNNSISLLTSAAGHLHTMLEDGDMSDGAELVELIMRESRSLQRQTMRLQVMLDPVSLPPRQVGLAQMLTQAASAVKDVVGGSKVSIRPAESEINLTLPDSVLICLFEAILLSHVYDNAGHSTTIVEQDTLTDTVDVRVATDLPSDSPPAEFNIDWRRYVRCLTGRLPAVTALQQTKTNSRLITQLTIMRSSREKT